MAMSSRDATELAVLISADRTERTRHLWAIAFDGPIVIMCAARRPIILPGGKTMFAVIFEVNPKAEQWDTYLGYAKLLRPELEQIGGFIDNERFSSLRRKGWVLSLSTWRDEKAVVRWRTSARQHEVQQPGRTEVFSD